VASSFSESEIRDLLRREEGQYLEFKSLWDRGGESPVPVPRRRVRDWIAEYTAAFANADGGTILLGVEDDGTPSGHDYPEKEVDKFLAVASKRLRSAVEVREQRVTLDGEKLVLIQVPSAPQAVMVEGNGFPYRTGDRVIREPQEIINLDLKTPQRRVLLAEPEGFTNESYRKLNQVDRDQAYREIQELVLQGVVLPAESSGRGAVYRTSPDLLASRKWLESRVPELKSKLREQSSIQNADYREMFSVTRSTAVKELRRLVESGFLVLEGERRGARYVPGPTLRLDED